MIYLDHAATTAIRPEVLAAMEPCLTEQYGNASSVYTFGAAARQIIDRARRQCAKALGASPAEICFTSGGTESDNQALMGAAWLRADRGRHMITSKVEHHAVLNTCAFLEKLGWEVTYLDVDRNGAVDPDDVSRAMRPDTVLISIMTANNELGTLEPVEQIGEIAGRAGVLFHTDAVQAFGHVPLDIKSLHADLVSVSAHKIGGPKGAGFLFVRRGLELPPLLHGGEQERGRRAGTENTAGIAGLGMAAELAAKRLSEEAEAAEKLRDLLESRILSEMPYALVNASGAARLPGHLSVSFPGVPADMALIMLDEAGICASAGSACASGSPLPSHVLKAAGLDPSLLHSTLRFSVGADNTEEEILRTVDTLKAVTDRLRAS